MYRRIDKTSIHFEFVWAIQWSNHPKNFQRKLPWNDSSFEPHAKIIVIITIKKKQNFISVIKIDGKRARFLTVKIPLVDYSVGWMDIPMIKRHWFINIHKDMKQKTFGKMLWNAILFHQKKVFFFFRCCCCCFYLNQNPIGK